MSEWDNYLQQNAVRIGFSSACIRGLANNKTWASTPDFDSQPEAPVVDADTFAALVNLLTHDDSHLLVELVETGISVDGRRYIPTKCEVGFSDGASLLVAKSCKVGNRPRQTQGEQPLLLFVGKLRKALFIGCVEANRFGDLEDMLSFEVSLRDMLTKLWKAGY